MLNVMWKLNVKTISFEVEENNCSYIATVTAKKCGVRGCLDIDISISDLDERFSISCYTRTAPHVNFNEKDIERYAVQVLEEYGERFIEHYEETAYEWFGA